jgi:hypothetical protein
VNLAATAAPVGSFRRAAALPPDLAIRRGLRPTIFRNVNGFESSLTSFLIHAPV